MKMHRKIIYKCWHAIRPFLPHAPYVIALTAIFFIMTGSLYFTEALLDNSDFWLFRLPSEILTAVTLVVIAILVALLAYWLSKSNILESLYQEGILKENLFTKRPLKIFCVLFYIIFLVCCLIRFAFLAIEDPLSSKLPNYLILSGIISIALAALLTAILVGASLKKEEHVRQIKIFFLGTISATVIYLFGYLGPFLARSQGTSPFVQLYVIPTGLILLLGFLTVLYVDQRERAIRQETKNNRFKYPLWDAFIAALAMPGILVAALNNALPSTQDQHGTSNQTQVRLERVEQQTQEQEQEQELRQELEEELQQEPEQELEQE